MFYPAPKRSTQLFRVLQWVINKRFKERALWRGVPGLKNANFYEIKMEEMPKVFIYSNSS